ncbi:MAG: YbaB/EbfC family nucleoid-associated protein [Caldisericaceae bacterium]
MKNINDLMKKARELQDKMEKIEVELNALEVEGSSSGDLVKAKVTGKLEVVSLEIAPSLIEANDKEMLEDLIIAAIRDAQNKARAIASEKFAELGLPGGMGGVGFPN